MPARAAVRLSALAAILIAPLSTLSAQGNTSDVGIGLSAGTMGIGVSLSKLLVSHVGLRVQGNFFNLTLNGHNTSDVTYDAKLKVQSFSGLLDLYPGARGAFRLSVGVVTDPAKVTGTGVATGGDFTLNGHTYTASQVGTLSATGQFPSVLPYVGIGFGTAASKNGGLSLTFDLGIAIGKPSINLTATGAANNAALQSDLNAQAAKTQTDLNKVPGYPVIAVGLMYRF